MVLSTTKAPRKSVPATAFGIALLCLSLASVSIALFGRVGSAFTSGTRCNRCQTLSSTTATTSRISTSTTSSSSSATTTTTKTALHMSSFLNGGGWDNDNFLDSLSGGGGGNADGTNDALERANDEYYKQSKYGRPVAVDNEDESPPPSNTRLSYKESLQRRKEQQQQKRTSRSNSANDMSAVSDAAAEVYSYSYNKNVDVSPATDSSPSNSKSNSSPFIDIGIDNEGNNNDAATSAAPPPPRTEEPALSKEIVEKVKASHDDPLEEAAQGGSRFRELLERAREQEALKQQQKQLESRSTIQSPSSLMANTNTNTNPPSKSTADVNNDTDAIVDRMPIEDLRGLTKRILRIATENRNERILSELKALIGGGEDEDEENAVAPPSLIMTPEEIATLSVEQQARLYREFFYVQQKKKSGDSSFISSSSAKPIGSTASNYLEAGIGFDGRKIGRNKDADAVSNASDAYFARLKKDSTTRNLARYSGNDAKANEIFHDPSIQDIKVPKNPYLEDHQKRMRDVVETVPEEMLVFQEYNTNSPEEQRALEKSSGVSYKDKLLQKKQEREEQRKRQQQQQNDNNNNTGGGGSGRSSNGHPF